MARSIWTMALAALLSFSPACKKATAVAVKTDIALTALDGREVRFDDYRRKVTVVSFWGTFCAPCIEELPELQKLQERYAADPDVAILAVTIDSAKTAEERAAIQATADKLKLSMPVLADRGGLAARLVAADPATAENPEAPKAFGVPLLVVIDPAFKVYRERGRTGPDGYFEKHVALIEQARDGKLPPEPVPPEISATHSSSGVLTMSIRKTSAEGWKAVEPDIRDRIRQAFPKLSGEAVDKLVKQVEEASREGGMVDLFDPATTPGMGAAIVAARDADRIARKDPKQALVLYRKAWDGGLRVPDPLYNAACVAAMLGGREEAFLWLDRSVGAGWSEPKWMSGDADLASLRGDPRFDELVRRAGDNAQKALAAEGAKEPGLRDELLALVDEDQSARQSLIRGEEGASKRVEEIDTKSTAKMKAVVAKYGWPGNSLVGERGARAAFLLVQHADRDPAFQKQCLELLDKAVKANDASPKDYAYLLDRVLVAEEKPQRYGTQFHKVGDKLVPRPIEDPARVDERRRSVGLGTMAEYEEQMKQTYAPALERERDAGTPSR